MHRPNLLVAGFVSLIGMVSSESANGKDVIARRSFTSINGGCTAVCKDNLFTDCDVQCSPQPTATPRLHERAIVTVTKDGCTAVCWDKTPGTECSVQCEGFSTAMPLPTSKPPLKPLVQKRGFTTTSDDCTAVCWDMMPGTGCDVQCHDTALTTMPASTSGVSALWRTVFTSEGCTWVCQDLNPGSECAFVCPGVPAPTPGPTKGSRAARIEAREDIQARQAHDARLARKFNLTPREAIAATMAPRQAGMTQASAALAAASAIMSQAISTGSSMTPLPPAASAALSEAQSFLASVAAAPSTSMVTITTFPTTAAPSTSMVTITASSAMATPSTSMTTITASPGSSQTLSTASVTSYNSSTVTTADTTYATVSMTTNAPSTTMTDNPATSLLSMGPSVYKDGAPIVGSSLAGYLLVLMTMVLSSMAFEI